MIPLIDGDILLHEIGWSGEFPDEEGEIVILDFERVAGLLDRKIELICEDVDATGPPMIYITGSKEIIERENKERKWRGEDPLEYLPIFRYDVAKSRPYKGTRKNPKPYHFYNIVSYLKTYYNVVLSDSGLEADDMMCIEQMSRDDTIICSRDKDLRICPGLHFSWECGGQAAKGPTLTDKVGWLEMEIKEKVNSTTGRVNKEKKVTGYGLSFFYFQMLAGDAADNIPGLPKWGAVKAYDTLHKLDTEQELYKAVKALYKEVMGDEAKDYFLEQANLLWMVQEKGRPYEFPKSV